MNGIGWAVKQLQDGARVQRAGWNGMWLVLVKLSPAASAETVFAALGRSSVDDQIHRQVRPFVMMFTATGELAPWLCSQTDLLAMDWELVPPTHGVFWDRCA